MKIGIAYGIFGSGQGPGIDAVIGELARQSAGHADEVFFIASNPGAKPFSGVEIKYLEDGTKLYLLPPRNIYWVGNTEGRGTLSKTLWHVLNVWNGWLWFPLVRILSAERPDVLNCHTLAGISTVIWSAANASGVPVIQTLHNYELLSPRATLFPPDHWLCNDAHFPIRLYRSVRRKLSETVQGVIACSHAILVKFEEERFFRFAAKRVIANPCPQDAHSPGSRFKTRNQKPAFVFLGELVSHKGIQVLLEAFQRVDGDKATLYIGGRGPLEGLVREVCRCCPNIHYPGFVVGEEKKKLLQSADALVVPSLFQDPSPLVILEAQHYGLPVIASRVGGIPELVSDGETGILVDPQDSVQLHRAIERLIQDPGLWSSMHQKMLEKDKSIHGGESYYRSFMNLCREIVTTHRPAR